MEELSIFDLLPAEEAERFKPIKSTDWKWSFADYPKEKNGLKVFSCFACGGGSTMGYKLAGCEVLGCCEIDPKMNEVYVKNHNPKYNYLMDIREFNALPNDVLPAELFDLDILDGSPPCTTFSMAGEREESWGKKKKFREGQKEQTLDDLSFVFIETVAKLRPKVVIMENVEGLILGEAWSYVQEIYRHLHKIGYAVHHWLLKGEHMGVPQTRHRVFFVATRVDIDVDPKLLDMAFNYEPVPYGEVKMGEGVRLRTDTQQYEMLLKATPKDHSIGDVLERLGQKKRCFNDKIVWEHEVLCTLPAKGNLMDGKDKTRLSKETVVNMQTFPQDYDFCGQSHYYVCGMSVPPVMIKRIVTRLIENGVFHYKNKEGDHE